MEEEIATPRPAGLTAALAEVRDRLASHVDSGGAPAEHDQASLEVPCASLDHLTHVLELSPFERAVLLLCAGVELDGRIAELCARLRDQDEGGFATFALAFTALPGAHWSACTPMGPLRRHRLIELQGASVLTERPLRIAEAVLHRLMGVPVLDATLAGALRPLPPLSPDTLPPSQRRVALQIAATWEVAPRPHPIHLVGRARGDLERIAAAASCAVGLPAFGLASADLPQATSELDELVAVWRRHCALEEAVLLVDASGSDAATQGSLAARLLQRLDGRVLWHGAKELAANDLAALAFLVERPTPSERTRLWEAALASLTDPPAREDLIPLAEQFDFSQESIARCAEAALARRLIVEGGEEGGVDDSLLDSVWASCREQSRDSLDELAQRLSTRVTLEDLIVPPAAQALLRQIIVHAEERHQVHRGWGFGARSSRGRGLSALFFGPSGTGKTMAAEAIANALRLDLYRVELSSVISKYIGETEKNLRRIFEAAQQSGAVLLFDEADALFGKRTEVRDSHDRYANTEVGFLLQQMEEYEGVAILTTNLRNALDHGFVRRLRFVVRFPFPDAARRERIWSGAFPPEAPLHAVAPDRLARLAASGGEIRNIALHAAFLAAHEKSAIGMRHLRRAAETEFAKEDRSVPRTEVEDWA